MWRAFGLWVAQFPPGDASSAPVAAQRLGLSFPQTAVISRVFHRRNRYHLLSQTIGETGIILATYYRRNRYHIHVVLIM